MKKLTISKLWKDGSKAFENIPREGMFITKKSVPIAFVQRPDKQTIKEEKLKLNEDWGKKTERVLRKLRIDTFSEGELPKPQALGTCNRCGRHGEVKKWRWLNLETNAYVEGWLCVAFCYPKHNDSNPKTRPLSGPPPIIKSVPVEQTFNRRDAGSDFGASNEERLK